jgi:type II secretory pathway predicted ATPase ExeA
MYLDFYNLKEKPFSLTPDPAFLYYSNSHKRAVAFLKYGLQESKGFIQLTGPVGSGKTTLLRAILQQLDERTKTAYVINPSAPFPDLLRSIMKDLEIPNVPSSRAKLELLDFFHDYLLVQMRRSNPVIVIFDEAQNLSIRNLEEIRMLSNFETTKEKLLQIVFVGQPELIPKLDQPELRQLKQRIQVRYHLASLKPSEVREYIYHRLHVAGCNGGLTFTDDACAAIYQFSHGIPRLINSVCDVTLLIGYVNERKRFDGPSIQEAIREMGGVFEESGADTATPEPETDSSAAESESAGEIEQGERAGGLSLGSDASAKEKSEESSECEPSPIDCIEDTTDAHGAHANDAPEMSAEEMQRDAQGVRADTVESKVPEELDFRPGTLSDTGVLAPPPAIEEKVVKRVTQRFQAGSSRAWEALEARRSQFKSLVQKYLRADVGEGRARNHQQGCEPPEQEQRDDAEPEHRAGAVDNEPDGILCATATATAPEEVAEHGVERAVQEPGASGGTRQRRGVWFLSRKDRSRKKVSASSNGFVDIKVAVLFKNGRVVHGIAEGLDLRAESFRFVFLDERGDSFEDSIRYDQIMAARIVETFGNGWKKTVAPSLRSPRGRQIIVTLSNGEVIDGITLGKFDPGCKRFFVVSPHRDGDVCWVLVERSATAGIATESFREGIYAEEYEKFDDFLEVLDADSAPSCQNESNGDLYFALEQFECALREYQMAREGRPDSIRLEFKVSLAHMNCGIKFMRLNDFGAAKTEFVKASEHERLCEKALSRVGSLRKLLRS